MTRSSANNEKKGTLKVIHLDDIDTKAVRAMIRYLYKPYFQDYLNTLEETNSATPKVYARVYIMAVKYGVEDLMLELCSSMTTYYGLRWSAPTDEVRLQRHKGLIEAINIIWEGTSSDDSMARPHLAAYCASNMITLCEFPKFVELMRSTELSSDICIAIAKKQRGQKEQEELEKELREEQEEFEQEGKWWCGNDVEDCGGWGPAPEPSWEGSVKGHSSKAPSVACFEGFGPPDATNCWEVNLPHPSVLSSVSNDSGDESFGWGTPAPSSWDTDSLP